MPEIPGNYRRAYANFRALEHALLDAKLAAAQQAFALLIRDTPDLIEIFHTVPVSRENPRRAYLGTLAQSLEAGDIECAQQAFDKLQEVSDQAGPLGLTSHDD